MIRRARRTREIPFSFDSFLDVVANVVGIIIRLILVVWVGARSYNSVKNISLPPATKNEVAVAKTEVLKDPMELELALHRQEMDKLQSRLLEHLKELQLVQVDQRLVEDKLGTLLAHEQGLQRERGGIERAAGQQDQNVRQAELSLAQLQQRRKTLADEIRAVELQPRKTQALRYRTPLSKPVESDEFFFECRQGRITFIDIASLVAEMRRGAEAKVDRLRDQWQLSDTTSSVGAFRLRYTMERQRELLETLADGDPGSRDNYRVQLSSWDLEPIYPVRGETLAQALTPGSQFRQVIDKLDPQLATVTIWVYPESFATFRELRDYLYERDLVVAGRPLPDGYPIRCSRTGTRSLGQ